MRKHVITFSFIAAVLRITHAHGMLQPASFPKTFDDVPFIERMDVKRAGYEPWEAEYDTNGNCIRGCPYPNITIEEHLDMMQRKTDEVLSELRGQGLISGVTHADIAMQNQTPGRPSGTSSVPQHPTPSDSPSIQIPVPNAGTQTPPTQPPRPSHPQQPPTKPAQRPTVAPTCNPNQPTINALNTIPLGDPLGGRPAITSTFGDRIHPVTGIRTPHSGVDLAAAVGTNVFATADGTVADVWRDSTCGMGIKITHSDGYETVYCHLDKQMVSTGDRVYAGCRIAQSGKTGRVTGPHLHYAIKKDGVYINPTKLMGRN